MSRILVGTNNRTAVRIVMGVAALAFALIVGVPMIGGALAALGF